MEISVLLVIGLVGFVSGFFLVAIPVFSNGGLSKQHQFRVMGEVWRGEHGGGSRTMLRIAPFALLIGTGSLFINVAQGDHERRERCVAQCEAAGYQKARIGPNSDRTKDRKTWFVACICEDGPGGSKELRASDLQ